MELQLLHVDKSYPLPGGDMFNALRDVSFSVEAGEFIIILGESGCGKSTLLDLISGLAAPSSGEIRANDLKIGIPHPSRAILFQQPTLLPWLSVKENIVFGCKIRGEIDRLDYRASQFIEIMGLAGFENARPAELSVGMAQRVCLARALIGKPDILLLDEPFASLDTFTRNHIQEELIRIWQVENFTVIFVTHDIDEAILLGTRILLIGDRPGSIQAEFDINLIYPRDMLDPFFIDFRSQILTRFKENYIGRKRNPNIQRDSFPIH